MKAVFSIAATSAAMAVLLALTGCAMFRIKVQDKDVENLPALDATYGAQDLRNLTDKVATSIATSGFIKNQAAEVVMIIYGVQPRTTTFVDTQAMTDRLRHTLMQRSDNKIKFVNESRRQEVMKEQGFQAQSATDDTRVAIGKQLGAKYMLTGALIEMQKQTGRQVRVSKTELVYYQLTIEITDLETGIIAWSTQEEFARAAREPLIGW
ncbi:MAG: hypothetical protein HYV36_04060 [Lentisphaerae bacterium]|nr:hypothetical protein [Lentisphaerota bacterium]